MSTLSLPECPGVLLTIFQIGREFRTSLTRSEILGLIKEHDPTLNGSEVFLHWFALRYLSEKSKGFCVADELGERLEREGIEPTLSAFNRRGWVVENANRTAL